MITTEMLNHLLEYAPAVAILLLLQWRHERRLDQFFQGCLKHLLADVNRDKET